MVYSVNSFSTLDAFIYSLLIDSPVLCQLVAQENFFYSAQWQHSAVEVLVILVLPIVPGFLLPGAFVATGLRERWRCSMLHVI